MNRGFTLLELLLVTFLFGLILIALFDMFFGYKKIFDIEQSFVRATGGARDVVAAVSKTARDADQVVSSHTFSGTPYTSGTTTAVFELPSINSSGDTIASTYDYVAIYASGTDAYQLTEVGVGSSRSAGTRHLTDVLQSMTFTYNSNSFANVKQVTVDVTASSTARQQTAQQHLREQIYLRNAP